MANTNSDLLKAYAQLQNENARLTTLINAARSHDPTDCDRKISALSEENAQLRAEILQNLGGGQADVQHVLGRIRQLETAQEKLKGAGQGLTKRGRREERETGRPMGSGLPISIEDAHRKSINMRGEDGSQAGKMDRGGSLGMVLGLRCM